MRKISGSSIDEIIEDEKKFPISFFFVNALQITIEQIEYASDMEGGDADRIIADLEILMDIYSELLCKSYELEKATSSEDWQQV